MLLLNQQDSLLQKKDLKNTLKQEQKKLLFLHQQKGI